MDKSSSSNLNLTHQDLSLALKPTGKRAQSAYKIRPNIKLFNPALTIK